MTYDNGQNAPRFMTHIAALHLTRFRNYETASMAGLSRGFIVLAGCNGAGKTNCLEAVSLLAPGRGLRGAATDDLRLRGAQAATATDGTLALKPAPRGWAVVSDLETAAGPLRLGTGEDPASGKRIAKINGDRLSALSQISDHIASVWFTPAMDGLFTGPSSERRRFFDRLVFAYDPAHAGRIRRYEQAMSQRSRILKEAAQRNTLPDATWLDGLELGMAETGVAIAASRLELLHLLRDFCADSAQGDFPSAAMALSGGPESMLAHQSALTVEDQLRESLHRSRARDAVTGGAESGAHKSDLHVTYTDKNMSAALCSTGEQKALLIGIILAHARFIAARRGEMPLLLLDEIAAHLDPGRRGLLFEILGGLKGQVWLTGTEHALFHEIGKGGGAGIAPNAQFFEVSNGHISAL